MSARAMWKAEICLGTLGIPVRMFAAVQDNAIHFRLVHGKDHLPLTQKMVEAGGKAVVESDEIQKAVQVERGLFVLVTEEERSKLEPKPSREITIEQVVERAHVDARWFDRPYFLGPDGDDTRYFALAEALAESDQLAIARWTMRSKRYAGAIHANDGYLMISSFRHADELVRIDRIRIDPHRAPDERELALADQLIATLADEFDPEEYRDDYRDRVLDLVRKKAAGKIIHFPKAKRQEPDDRTLLATLEASLKQER